MFGRLRRTSVSAPNQELGAEDLNRWLQATLQSAANSCHASYEESGSSIYTVNSGEKILMLMPAAHDHADGSEAKIEGQDGLKSLEEVLTQLPEDKNNLTCVIPLFESNNRKHWTLLVFMNNKWHLFDPKKKKKKYSLKPLMDKLKVVNFPDDQQYYLELQPKKNKTHSGYFTGYIAHRIFDCFFGGREINKDSIHQISEEDVEKNYRTCQDKIKKADPVSALVVPAPIVREEDREDKEEDASQNDDSSIVIEPVADPQPAEENAHPETVAEYISQIENAIDAINDPRCATAKQYCEIVLQEIQEPGTRSEETQLADCQALFEVATLLKNPDAENFAEQVGSAADKLLLDDPSRSSNWEKLRYALLGILGLGLIAVGVVAVCSGFGIGPGAVLVKAGLAASQAAAAGEVSVLAGAMCTAFSWLGLFGKTHREALKQKVQEIAPVERQAEERVVQQM